jgi:hypothetical protein
MRFLLILLLVGCGGGGDDPPEPAPTVYQANHNPQLPPAVGVTTSTH